MLRDLTGKKFGRLLVLSVVESRGRGLWWECLCDCGQTLVVPAKSLVSGHTKSCGCLHDELSSQRTILRNFKHGESKTRLYGIWVDMRKRCKNPNHTAYMRYGGRGISVCDEWSEYKNFSEWSKKNGYSEKLTLDRKDNNLGYSPQNCRWVSMSVQGRNKENNVTYTYDGKSLTVPEWSEITGIQKETLYNRLSNYRWSVEKALTTPVRRHKPYGT